MTRRLACVFGVHRYGAWRDHKACLYTNVAHLIRYCLAPEGPVQLLRTS